MAELDHGSIETKAPANIFDEHETASVDDREALLLLVAKYGTQGQDIYRSARSSMEAVDSGIPTTHGIPTVLLQEKEAEHRQQVESMTSILADLQAADAGYYDLMGEANETYMLEAQADTSARDAAAERSGLFELQSQAMEQARRPFVGIRSLDYPSGGGGGGGGGSSSLDYLRATATVPAGYVLPNAQAPRADLYDSAGVGLPRSSYSVREDTAHMDAKGSKSRSPRSGSGGQYK